MEQTLTKPAQAVNYQLIAPLKPGYEVVFSAEALAFITELHRLFNSRRLELLEARKQRQQKINAGQFLETVHEASPFRDADWKADPVPACLQDRRVEITGPVDRKMIVNALNSGAKVFMADFEDSTSPTWENIAEGQCNLYDAVRKQIDFVSADGKSYRLKNNVAVLKVRPRGWHLDEAHIIIDGEPASASLVDFGIFFFHNAHILAANQEGPFYYLPKMESHLEARLWDNVFAHAEQMLSIKHGTIKATVLIETITAAFEMEEIIYELQEHIAGLNAGRWDYIFSIVKKFHAFPQYITPDRSTITMDVPFMKAYAQQLVNVCHRRGTHAIGGMSAFIPSKDENINAVAFEKVRTDKEREASQGYDGTWVAHPKLVDVAMEIFDSHLGDRKNQKEVVRPHQFVPEDLLKVSSLQATITEAGFRTNINISLLYIESWLRGTGAAALYNLMEDAATAEISRAQLWQWINHKASLQDGRQITSDLYLQICKEEYQTIVKSFLAARHEIDRLATAKHILDRLVLGKSFEDFLTTQAYPYII
ncbi:malate synthase A [Pseudochryseolinea flava]|uniref:malate synthase n=1 Tax=Pseudochryseolinea flava TaxID=2059302 RepID=A0A364Y433_9BACT|nr:malate synthase A [Pseudochryseolinea flava]RAW00948.1 malate synthase A [Pseudochryseolinea flava]